MNQAQQPEALRLADRLEDLGLSLPAYGFDDRPVKEATAELRRLHSRVQELEAERNGAVDRGLRMFEAKNHWAERARTAESHKPLTGAQIASACLSYRHDFGLLQKDERVAIMATARAWEFALDKERAKVITGQPIHHAEELERNHSDEDAAIAAGKVQAAVQGRVG